MYQFFNNFLYDAQTFGLTMLIGLPIFVVLILAIPLMLSAAALKEGE